MPRSTGFQVFHQANAQDGEVGQRRVIDEVGIVATVERGMRRRPMAWAVEVQAGHCLGILNLTGTLVTGRLADNRIGILLPRAFMIVPGPARQVCLASRGNHARMLVGWPGHLSVGLADWITHRPAGEGIHILDCPRRDPNGLAFDRVMNACQETAGTFIPHVLGGLHELVCGAYTESLRFTLTHIDANLPDPIETLLEAIRENPVQSWSLKDAAAFAGYSPFHLSRTFRSIVGYGLPEYVDRCRTERAVEMVVGTDGVVDDISVHCGFGSTQALRDSFREYLGLLPSELRAAQADGEESFSSERMRI